MSREIRGAVVFLAGASGGIGRALVDAFGAAGAAEIVAAGRQPPSASPPWPDSPGSPGSPDSPDSPRVVPVRLDLADPEQVGRVAAQHAPRVDILVNAAGVNANRRLFGEGFLEAARQEMAVNYFGLLALSAAFAPAMRARGGGTIVNVLTLLSHVNLPTMATYCASKAAAHSITQALRAELAPSGVAVCGVYPTAVDTAMSRHLDGPKLAPDALAEAVVAAVRAGAEDVYPGAAEDARRALAADPKQVERRMAQRLS